MSRASRKANRESGRLMGAKGERGTGRMLKTDSLSKSEYIDKLKAQYKESKASE